MDKEIHAALNEWEAAVADANEHEAHLFDADQRPLLAQETGRRIWARLEKAHRRLTELGEGFLSRGEVVPPAIYLEILRPKEARA